MKHFTATIKEKDGSVLHPSYIGDVDEDYLVKFWGLDRDDVVEWEIKEVTDNQNDNGGIDV